MQSMDEKKVPALRVWSFETISGHLFGLVFAMGLPTLFFLTLKLEFSSNLLVVPIYLLGVGMGLFFLRNACVMDFYEDHLILWSLVRRKRIAYKDIYDLVYFDSRGGGHWDFYYIHDGKRVKSSIENGLSDRNVLAMDALLKNAGLKKVSGPSSKYRRRLFGWERK